MSTSIQQLKSFKTNEEIYPITHEDAIETNDGKTLSEKFDGKANVGGFKTINGISIEGSGNISIIGGDVDIVDNLDSEDANKVLSAKQGKELNERLKALEESPTGNMSGDYKKSTLQFYRQLGRANTDLKVYTDKLRESILGMEDFAKLGTGLFIHWGVYAVPAGRYTGTKQQGGVATQNINYNTEWCMRDLAIPRDVYKAYETQFTSTNWDAEEICRMASEAGMGYVVITAKHHDGFSLYPTEYGNWDVSTSSARNTILEELKDACEKYDLKFGLYFSQYWDWMAEGGFGIEKGGKWNGTEVDLYTEAQHLKYCESAAKQIAEMCEKFDPYILWYDPGQNYADKYQKIFRDSEDENYPDVITNDRLQYDRGIGDYGTGERTICLRDKKYAEACFTMNDTWGYSINNDNKYFGIEKVMKQFVLYSLAYGQNCLMNIGPDASGGIPAKQVECLTQIKNFIESYGSFRGYKRMSTKAMPKWGYTLQLEGNKILCYIVTKGNANYSNVTIDCVSTENLESVDILTSGGSPSYNIVGNCIEISGLALDATTKIGVVRLNYSKTPTILDANYLKGGSFLPSRVFMMVSNTTFDFTNLRYNITPSKKVIHTTEILWNGDTNDYCAVLNYTKSVAQECTMTLTITKVETEEVTTISYINDATESDESVHLENGKRYQLKFVVNGTNATASILFEGLTFNEVIVIIHPTSISLDKHNLTIAEDGTGQLSASVLPSDATDPSVTWSSSNTNVARVEDGLVIGESAGECIITATTTDGGLSDTCSVVVTAESQEDVVHPTSITLDKVTLDLDLGSSYQLIHSILPTNATYKSVSWESSNGSVASVNNGLVEGLALGQATISVTTTDGNKVASCIVNVNPIHPTSVSLNETSTTLLPGKSIQLSATILPTNATIKTIEWSSSNTDILEVEDGLVKAVGVGNATITATTTDGNKTATCEFVVNQETYDLLWEQPSLDGSSTQGEDTGLLLFSDSLPNWTLFGYAKNSTNPNTDNNATLYACVVMSSPWTGLRVDADNNNYPSATTPYSPLLPRFMAGTDYYINPITGGMLNSKPIINPQGDVHPICFSREGNVYKYSCDGVNWVTFTGLNTTQLNRLKTITLSLGFDWRVASGSRTGVKYRFLKTEHPCCVAIKYESEYPFYTLYHKYDPTLAPQTTSTAEPEGGTTTTPPTTTPTP